MFCVCVSVKLSVTILLVTVLRLYNDHRFEEKWKETNRSNVYFVTGLRCHFVPSD